MIAQGADSIQFAGVLRRAVNDRRRRRRLLRKPCSSSVTPSSSRSSPLPPLPSPTSPLWLCTASSLPPPRRPAFPQTLASPSGTTSSTHAASPEPRPSRPPRSSPTSSPPPIPTPFAPSSPASAFPVPTSLPPSSRIRCSSVPAWRRHFPQSSRSSPAWGCRFQTSHASCRSPATASALDPSSPRILTTNPERVQTMVACAQGLGVPRGSGMFRHALQAVGFLREEKLAAKVEYLKNTFRWSDVEVSIAVCKAPMVLITSKESLRLKSDFLFSEVGLEPAYIARIPAMLLYSLEGRTKPRHYVVKFLKENGLLHRNWSHNSIVAVSDKVFVETFIRPHKEAAPHLAQDYASACRGEVPARLIFTSTKTLACTGQCGRLVDA